MADDRELLSRIATGDEAAFKRLYARYADRVFRYALTLLRNRHLAEEVVQETMVAVWRGAGSFKGGSLVSTWIFGIARNQAHALLRREARGAREPEESLVLPDPAEGLHCRDRVLAALEELPPEQREVVVLAFYEGLSYREIGRLLGVPEGTVKSRMYFAKRKLREVLT